MEIQRHIRTYHNCDYNVNKYKTITINKFDTLLLNRISIKLFKHECNATQRDCYMRHFPQFFSISFHSWKMDYSCSQTSNVVDNTFSYISFIR